MYNFNINNEVETPNVVYGPFYESSIVVVVVVVVVRETRNVVSGKRTDTKCYHIHITQQSSMY